ncbi:MAG: alpha/beta fold hydrolase [Caulobacteraceae bacterium]
MPGSIVMVHGAFCRGAVFDLFKIRFERAGWRVLAPDLPGHGRNDPPSAVRGASIATYAGAIADLCAHQSSPPVLIGHSLGGLVAEHACQRTRVSALILIAPSPAWGTGTAGDLLSWLGLPLMGWSWTSAITPDRRLAERRFFGEHPGTVQDRTLGILSAESGRALLETYNWWLDPFASTLVNPQRIGAPVLGFAGGRDQIHSRAMVEAQVGRLGGQTRFIEAAGHWMIGE